MSDLALELFGGPGGFGEGARMAGLGRHVGIELERWACATRAAAGHSTIRADVARFPVAQLAGRVSGLFGSPPCTTFSAAGDGAGKVTMRLLRQLAGLTLAGHERRQLIAGLMADELKASPWQSHLTTAERGRKIRTAVASAVLVAEPARYIAACTPEWIALEQVPAVLPIWQAYAARLATMGYSAWCGVLNAADYGVPQTRQRAILIASRIRAVRRPEPTHYDPRRGAQLWGTPWVTMAEALNWGADARPAPTITAGGTATGGAEPIGHRDRDALAAERDAGRWTVRTHNGGFAEGYERSIDRPAPSLTSKSGGQWHLRHGAMANAPVRAIDQPAATIRAAHDSASVAWVRERPATTVQCDPRVGRPGHKDRDQCESQFAQDSVRITPAEAAALQSFPPGYPFQGTKTKQFEQIGNAVPPLLAAHVIAMASGVSAPVVLEDQAS